MRVPPAGPRVPRPTRAGIATILATSASVLAAWLLGSVELAGAGMVVGGLTVLGFGRVALTRGVTVHRHLGQSRVGRGQPLNAQLEVAAGAGLLAPLGVVEDPVGERGLARVALGHRRASSVTYRLPTSRRGPVRVGPATVTVTDAFGLWRRSAPGPGIADLLVLPGIVAVDPPPAWTRRQGRVEGQRTGPLGVPGEEFHAVRPWQDGDDVRHVHWPSVARTDELMVRQHEPAGTGRLVLELDTVLATWSGSDHPRRNGGAQGSEHDDVSGQDAVFEQMVTVATSLLVATTRAGDTVDLIVGSEPMRAVNTGPRLDRALDHLATLEPRPPGTGTAPAKADRSGRRIRITGPRVGHRTGPPSGDGTDPALVITVDRADPGSATRPGASPTLTVHPDRDPATELAPLIAGSRKATVSPRAPTASPRTTTAP